MTSISDTIIIQAKKRDLDAKEALLEMEKYGQQLMDPDDGLSQPELDAFKKIFSARSSAKGLKKAKELSVKWREKARVAVRKLLFTKQDGYYVAKKFKDDRAMKAAAAVFKRFNQNENAFYRFIRAYSRLLKYRSLRNDLYKQAIKFKEYGY